MKRFVGWVAAKSKGARCLEIQRSGGVYAERARSKCNHSNLRIIALQHPLS